MAAVVADTSPLIALHQLGPLSLLQRLFGEIYVPPAVARKLSPGMPELPLRAKRLGFIPEVRPHLDEFIRRGFRLSPGIRDKVLADVNPLPPELLQKEKTRSEDLMPRTPPEP